MWGNSEKLQCYISKQGKLQYQNNNLTKKTPFELSSFIRQMYKSTDWITVFCHWGNEMKVFVQAPTDPKSPKSQLHKLMHTEPNWSREWEIWGRAMASFNKHISYFKWSAFGEFNCPFCCCTIIISKCICDSRSMNVHGVECLMLHHIVNRWTRDNWEPPHSPIGFWGVGWNCIRKAKKFTLNQAYGSNRTRCIIVWQLVKRQNAESTFMKFTIHQLWTRWWNTLSL